MQNVTVSLEKAMAEFTLAPEQELDPVRLRAVVVKAGFTPRDIEITAVGEIIRLDGQFALKVTGSGQLFRLVDNEQLTRLKQVENVEGKVVTIVGKVLEEKKPPLALSIEEFRLG